MTERKIVNRNVLILPPDDVMREAVRRGDFIGDSTETVFQVNRTDKLPHLTVHQFAIPEYSLNELTKAVQEFATGMGPFPVNLTAYSIFGGSGIFWDALKSDPLRMVHERFVNKINDLRDGYIMDQHRDFLTAAIDIGSERRKSLGVWGNPLAMKTFWPHITLASCKHSGEAEEILEKLPQDDEGFEVTSLHITEVGPNGTCPGSLIEIPLTG